MDQVSTTRCKTITKAAGDAVESGLNMSNKVTLSSILPAYTSDDDSAQLESEKY